MIQINYSCRVCIIYTRCIHFVDAGRRKSHRPVDTEP